MVKVKVSEAQNHENDKNDEKIYFMALGGLEHVGQNMYVYKYKGKYLVIDPDSALYKKNEMEKNDPVIQAHKKLIREKIQSTPIQIVASKAERIR